MKTLRVVAVCLLFCSCGFYNRITQNKSQNKPKDLWAYSYGRPESEYLTFKSLLPNDQIMILVYDKDGNSVHLLVPQMMYEELQKRSEKGDDYDPRTKLYKGTQLAIDYIQNNSLISEADITKMTPEEQKKARAFNNLEKYTLMSSITAPIYGRMDKSSGRIKAILE